MGTQRKGSRAAGQLAEALIERWLSIQGYSPDTSLQIFQAFDLTGFDHKGQLTSGYGERGYRFSLGASVDFGDLILPGIVTAEVGGSFSGERAHYSLLIVQRHPAALYLQRQKPLPARAPDLPDATASSYSPLALAKPAWATVRPICLLLLSGRATTFTAKFNAEMGVGVQAGVGELGLEVKATAAAAAELKGRVIRLVGPSPLYYHKSSDRSLNSDFGHYILEIEKRRLKDMVVQWLQHGMGADSAEEEEPTEAEEKAEEIIAKTAEAVGIEVKELPNLRKLFDAITHPTTEQLLDALRELEDRLKETQSDTDQPPEEMALTDARLRQLEGWQALLEARKRGGEELAPAPEDLPPFAAQLAHLNLSMFGGYAGASAEASASFSLSVGDASAAGSAGAGAQIDGAATLIPYRFQTFALGNRGEIALCTQDTSLTYRHVHVAAAVKAGLTLELPSGEEHPLEKELEKEKEKYLYRTITYQAATAYWFYPAGNPGSHKTATVPALGGSGVSFGTGIQVSRLLRLALASQGDLDRDLARQLGVMAKQLRLTDVTLKSFLQQLGAPGSILHDVDPAQFKTDTVILESSFAFPNGEGETFGIDVHYQNKKKRWRVTDLLGAQRVRDFIHSLERDAGGKRPPTMEDWHTPHLDAIRLRYRLADEWDRDETIFKLGFSKIVGLEFRLDKIQRAGHEGVIDLHVWFPHQPFNRDPQTGYELTLPPVALLHH